MQTFGEIIKEKRKAKKWTVEKMAKKLGTTRNTIYHWQRNECYPNILIACDIADLFDCSLDELCGRKKQ